MALRHKIKLVIIVAFLLPIFTLAIVSAHETSDVLNSSTETEQHSEQPPKDPDTSAQGIAERIAKKKAALQASVTAAEQAKIKSRCKAAQGVVKSLQGRINGIQTSRTNVYNNTVSRLNSLTEKLKASGLDTAQLEGQISELSSKIDTFKTDLSDYEQAVSDLATMDCSSDPTAFKAALDDARALRAKVNEDIKGIRSYINETIKETIKQLRQQLEQVSGDGNNSEGAQ